MTSTRRVLVAACAAAVFAGTAAAAQAAPVPDNLSAGTHDNTVLVDGGVELGKFSEAFSGATMPAGWLGAGSVHDGVMDVDNTLVDSGVVAGPGSSLRFRATFGADDFQNIGFAEDFDDGPWAIFSTGDTNDHLFARVANGTDPQTSSLPLAATPGDPHDFRIDWTATGFVYYVDGAMVAELPVPVSAPMRAQASDIAAAIPLTVDSMGLRTAATGTFTSGVLDGGDARVTGVTFTPAADTPTGTTIAYEVRSGPNATAGSAGWTDWRAPSAAAPARYLQYRATLSTTDLGVTPRLTGAAADFSIDATAPAVTIDAITLSSGTARVTFRSDDAGATYTCSLDGGAFAGCSSPAQFRGLAAGPHTIAVRARDGFGNAGTATKPFTVPTVHTVPSAPSAPASPPADTHAPRIKVQRSVLVSAGGKLRLRLLCPADEVGCTVTVKLRRHGVTIARRTVKIAGGAERVVKLRVPRSVRRVLADRDHLKVDMTVTARDDAGNQRTKRGKIKLHM
jgi:hypothetical protein